MAKTDFKKYDIPLMVIFAALVLFGLLMVLSSSYIMAGIKRDNNFWFFSKQIIWTIVGTGAMYITAFKIPYSFYQRYSKVFYCAILAALLIVLLVGPVWSGVKRWFDLGAFAVQPSEFAKLAMVFLMADFIARKENQLSMLKSIIAVGVYITPIVVAIALEPDFGSNVLIILICGLMLFCTNIKISKAELITIFSLIFVVVALEIFRKNYRIGRIVSYFKGIFDLDSVLVSSDRMVYQLKLSLYALGSGGPFFGKGLGNSDMKLMYLPEAHSDFIYPIIGEEFGFIGAIVVIGAFAFIFAKGIKISQNSPDVFAKYLALGITLVMTLGAMMNIGVSLGILPTKGLALPFISAGGTSLLMNMAAAGILVNLSQYAKAKGVNR